MIDQSTNTVYVTHKVQAPLPDDAAWYLDALDATTGTERAGFPLKISGAADNDPSVQFTPRAPSSSAPACCSWTASSTWASAGTATRRRTGWVVGVNVTAATPHITAM